MKGLLHQFQHHTVARQLGAALIAITSLAVMMMATSVFIAQTTKGYAAAINQAGTLRMQSYRIASSLVHTGPLSSPSSRKRTDELVEEFLQRLTSPRIQQLLHSGVDPSVQAAYTTVSRQWYEELQPILKRYLSLAEKTDRSLRETDELTRLHQLYLNRVDQFVDDIHKLVRAFEDEAEGNIRMLRMVQAIALLLTLAIAVVILRILKQKVFNPLKDLDACARAASQGDFSMRSNYRGDNELGQLSMTFNTMSEELSRIYTDLERRVAEQTFDLARSHRSIEMLYEVTRHLSQQPINEDTMHELLSTLSTQLGIDSATLCLGHGQGSDAMLYATTRRGDITGGAENCQQCFADGQPVTLHYDKSQEMRTDSIPVRDKQQQYGVLLIDWRPSLLENDFPYKLFDTIANHIATALNMAQQTSNSRRLALLDERSVIARELHDSLAQSLSYLKIQVSRLEKIMDSQNDTTQEVVENLREGLSSAYRQLRELLTTFRLQMDKGGLHGALEKTVEEFAERGDLQIQLDDHLKGIALSPNAEIHLIQIVREALSNVLKHANAEHVEVSLELERGGDATLSVRDDGAGIGEFTPKQSHYGTTIMLERARSLGGTLQLRPGLEGGTEVVLHFNLHKLEKNVQEPTV